MTTAIQYGDHHLTVMHRDDWGGGPVRRGYIVPHQQFRGLVIHHTVTIVKDWDSDGIVMGDLDDLANHQRYLQVVRQADLGPEVPYSWTIAPHPDPKRCTILEGRGWGRTGAHTAGLNSSRYGVAVIGNTSSTPITPAVVSAIRFLGAWLADQPTVKATTGHRDHKATECPGATMYAALNQVQPVTFTFDPVTEEVPPMPDVVSDWAKDSWNWALVNGITTGGNPQGNVTREAAITMMHRLSKLKQDADDPAVDWDVILKPVFDSLRAVEARLDTHESGTHLTFADIAAQLRS